MAKPKQVSYYETSNGPVKTLDEWKASGVFELLKVWKDTAAEELTPDAFRLLVNHILTVSIPLVEILSIKEKGRPNGSKNSKPRKPKAEPATT